METVSRRKIFAIFSAAVPGYAMTPWPCLPASAVYGTRSDERMVRLSAFCSYRQSYFRNFHARAAAQISPMTIVKLLIGISPGSSKPR